MSSFSAFEELFGAELESKSGPIATNSALSGKIVGVYFSAHWCPPCRRFTPNLVTFYNKLLAMGKEFEIVFASSDRDDAGFKEYYDEMPWLAIPYNNRQQKDAISKKCRVEGIPMFVIFDKDGSIITKDGRAKVSSDPEGASFPWFPTTIQQDLGSHVLDNNGEQVPLSSLNGKYLALYFSAHWCPPCKRFTPILSKFYARRKELGFDDLEIIFVSSDNEESEYQEYYGEMPWLTLPFKDPRCDTLSGRFEVEGIPSLVILDADRKVVTKEGVMRVQADLEGAKFPYFPEPIVDLSQGPCSYDRDVNNCPSFIAFLEALDDSGQDSAKEAIRPLAEQYATAFAGTADGPKMIFFTATESGGIVDRIRTLLKKDSMKDKTTPSVVILDLGDNGGYYLPSQACEDITEDYVRAFVDGYFNKTLTRKQLSSPGGEDEDEDEEEEQGDD